MAASRMIELRFPAAGVVRRPGFRDSYDASAPFPTPWAVNMRPQDVLARRLRGGSRPGLTKYIDDDLGHTVSALIPMVLSSASGISKILVAIGGDYLGVIEDGELTSTEGLLVTESGEPIVTEAWESISLDTIDIPASRCAIVRGTKIYLVSESGITVIDPKTRVCQPLTATSGVVPTGCSLGTIYRDRFAVVRHNAIFLSGLGNFRDWQFGKDVTHVGRAMPFQLSEAGKVGEEPTALVAHKDAYLLSATENGLWVVSGDPAATGSLRNVSRAIGIIGQNAWTTVDDMVVFLSRDGLFSVSAKGEKVDRLSGSIPNELLDIDVSTTTVLLGHDARENGIHLYLTPSSGVGSHWYYDLDYSGFWPISLQEDHQPTAMCRVDGRLVLASSDGYLRNVGGDDDDGEDIESHLVIGPLRPGSAAEYGMISSLNGVLSVESGAVVWNIVTGDSPEAACENAKTAIELYQSGDTAGAASYVSASGSWGNSRSHMAYPRCRSMWATLWLRSTSRWAFEGITLEIQKFGRWR